jgi:hypothetical protein
MDEKKQMMDYLGFEVDAEDWQNIKEMIEQIRTDKIKYDILYWSNKHNRGYIVRTNKTK